MMEIGYDGRVHADDPKDRSIEEGFLTEVRAIREGVAFAADPQVVMIRVEGAGAAGLIDRVATRPAPRGVGRANAALLLDEEARVFADVLLCSDRGGVLVLAEGPKGGALVEWLQAHAPADASVRDLADTHSFVAIDGPFAWEPMIALCGKEVLGVPPQSSFRLDPFPGLGVRASRTGEHGYALVIPREGAGELDAKLAELRAGYSLATPGRAALDLCVLENGYFSIRTPGCEGLTPVELQLQWRVRHGRPFVGSEALLARQATRGRGRVTWWVAEDAGAVVGDEVRIAGKKVGEVLQAAFSPVLGRTIGLALVVDRWAHPGLPCNAGAADVRLRTATPPLIDNRSLYVKPSQHTFARREEYGFPPLGARRG